MRIRTTSTREPAAGHKIQTTTWDEVLDGGLSKAASAARAGADAPGPEILIQGRLPNAASATRAGALHGESDSAISAAAKTLTGRLLDELEAAVRGGARLELDIEGRHYRLANPSSGRDIGNIEGDLKVSLDKCLKRSISAAAGARTIASATNPGDANMPGWLCPPAGRTDDGRSAYAKGKAFEPKLAPGVWRVFERYLAGDSMSEVANYLNNEYIPGRYREGARTSGRLKYQPPGMGAWSAATVNNLLKTPATIGLHGGALVDLKVPSSPAPVRPALLTWSTFRLVQDLLDAKLGSTRHEAAHLLAGRLYCLTCRQEGRGETQLSCLPRKEGLALRCPHNGENHKVPRYDAFEEHLLRWVHGKQEVVHELDDILRARDEELMEAIREFGWPPANTAAPASLEEAVLRLQAPKSTYRSDEEKLERIAAFIRSMASAPRGEERNALRRKMRNVLRRHIERVFVGDVCVQPLSVEERPHLVYLGRATADSVFDATGAVRPGARLLAVAVQRFGQANPDPEFRVALSSHSFELPSDTDWERILLAPPEEQADTSAGRPLPAGSAAGSLAGGGKAPAGGARGHDRAVDAGEYRTGYQPSSASEGDKAIRPWGIHIAGEDLEATAREVREVAVAAGLSMSDEQAHHFAFGLLLHSLELFAKTDRWLGQTLAAIHRGPKTKAIHLRCFRELRRADDVEPDWSALERGMVANLIGKIMKSESAQEGLRKALEPTIDGLAKKRSDFFQIMFAAAALHEVVRWAERRRAAGLHGIEELAAELAKDTKDRRVCTQVDLHALGQAFAHEWAWATMAAHIKEMLSLKARPKPGVLVEWPNGRSLMAALQEQRFPATDGLSAPVHLHGESRALDKIRSELGL